MKRVISYQSTILSLVMCLSVGGASRAWAVAEVDAHAGHAHNSPAGGEDSHVQRVAVTQEQVARLGIKITRAVEGTVHSEIRVPGEIKVNADRFAHVVPRAAGVVRAVTKSLGDHVQAGEILAWVESEGLAEAKLDFYAMEAEVGCCELLLPRAKAIHGNVARLIRLLKEGAAEEAIRKLDGLEMGQYRGQLLIAHAAYLAARTTHEREADLHAKQISSAQELLAAETALRQARAAFQATMDTARFETMIEYTEAAQERQVAAFNAVAAEKRLRLKGADDEVVTSLRALIPKVALSEPCQCPDPNCAEGDLPKLGDTLGKDARFAWYALRAPFDGTLVEKHIVMGESIDTASEVFTVADLSSVWVDLAISQDAIPSVEKGYAVTIRLPNGGEFESEIAFVSPIVDADTRRALARVVLDNSEERFRPGTFVEAGIRAPTEGEAVVVPQASVQLVNDHTCLFVWGDSDFELRDIVTGASDGQQIEILEGLQPGEAVASENAFHLKAELATSGRSSGGHGHAH
ncbi:MAG: efflux RND transporter periplasmic adaptor subunit [Kiritimatiellae bacterium]|nr:efflux RND transporter periplasmic adaptor subunit [Kiritimatiellia bacterium]